MNVQVFFVFLFWTLHRIFTIIGEREEARLWVAAVVAYAEKQKSHYRESQDSEKHVEDKVVKGADV